MQRARAKTWCPCGLYVQWVGHKSNLSIRPLTGINKCEFTLWIFSCLTIKWSSIWTQKQLHLTIPSCLTANRNHFIYCTKLIKCNTVQVTENQCEAKTKRMCLDQGKLTLKAKPAAKYDSWGWETEIRLLDIVSHWPQWSQLRDDIYLNGRLQFLPYEWSIQKTIYKVTDGNVGEYNDSDQIPFWKEYKNMREGSKQKALLVYTEPLHVLPCDVRNN